MFTGLIQGKGRIDKADNMGTETRLRIAALYNLADIRPGESIAVNGVCLTVETFGDRWFTAYASRETMEHSNLGEQRAGSVVNLERALAMGDRLGGHIVSGHVDCVAEVAKVSEAGESRIYRLTFPEEQGRLVVPKGSVALDGISLTVNDCGPDFLEVNIIPSTQGETTIGQWKPGRRVNMETDVIGKYVLNMIGPWMGANASGDAKASKVTMEFLRQNGF